MARNIEPGTLVIDAGGSEYVYRGTSSMAGMSEIRFDLRHGGHPGIHCDLEQVAPAEVAAKVNLKDPRITVRKIEPKPRSARGPWHRHIALPGPSENTGWHKTKRDATAEAAYRLAIADWHAEGPAARLGYLRMQIEAENISYAEIAELQSLAAHIEPGDVQLLEWAGVEE